MPKSFSRRTKILAILGLIAVFTILVLWGIDYFKGGATYNFFSGINWTNPYSPKASNPFENLKLNPFKK